MRLHSVRLRNMGPFKDYTLDLNQLGDARLVAICGPNGIGKSCLLELAIPGVLYRTTPTRGNLTDLAQSRDAMLESRISNGANTYTIRHLVDAVSRNGESVVLNGDGQPVYKSTKVSAFDKWSAAHFPAEDELFVSTFCPQGQAGFIGLTDGERKSVLLKVLGIARYEKLAERARKYAGEKRNALTTIEARIADERARGVSVEAAEQAMADARAAVAAADERLATARAALEQTQALAAAAERLAGEYRASRTRRRELTQQLAAATATQTDLETRIANNRAILARATEIRAAVADIDRLRTEAARIDAEITTWRNEHSRLNSEIASLTAQRNKIYERANRATVRLADQAQIAQALTDLPEYETGEEKASDVVFERQTVLDGLRTQHVAGMGERVQALRGGLEEIRGDSLSAYDIAIRTLSADDVAHRLASELPGQVSAAERALSEAKVTLARTQKATAECRQLADRLPEIIAADTDLREANAETATLDKDLDACIAQREAENARLAPLEAAQRANTTAIAETEPLAKQADALARAEARLSELEPQATACLRDIVAINVALEEVPEPPADPAVPIVDDQAVRAAEQTVRQAHATLAVAEQQLTASTERAERLATLTTEKTGIEADLADWNRLSADLGKDGLQALEIDAAGPELTARVNDLLHHCVGSRFSVLINTQPLSADGKRTLEGCEILVTDTVGGREAEASTFSGGERVILGEAISLALTMLGCQRAGIDRPTLVRDETGAALDPENARAYVGMLRRAADFVGADRVLFVTHDRAVQELADARVQVRAACGRREVPSDERNEHGEEEEC